MTIKPVGNQKSAKEEGRREEEGTSQSAGGVRATHRAVVLNQLSSSESQALPREIRFDSDSVGRHRRSPHKNLGRLKQEHYHKRDRRERDKTPGSPSYHHHGLPSVSGKKQTSSSCSSPLAGTAGGRSPKSTLPTGPVGGSHSGLTGVSSGTATAGAVSLSSVIEEALSGYNSGDEHIGPKDAELTPDEWKKRDDAFAKDLQERGFVLHEMEEDGACLFRAISLQIYGDQDMHEEIRHQTMNYIYQNREYFAQFVTEDIADYVKRKRANHVHGNHIEIQAMSEMYNRSVELYCYQVEPINIFNSDQINNGNEPLRLAYQRGSHYNAIVNPYKASVGVGLGLAGYRPDELDIKQVDDAVRMSEELEIEKTMFEDKLKTTDWEATNEAIEEQIARESYVQWCRDNMRKSSSSSTSSTVASAAATLGGGSSQNKSTSTITSTEMMASASGASFSGKQQQQQQQQTSSFLLEMRKSPTIGQQTTLTAGLAYDGGLKKVGERSAACSSGSKNSSFDLDCLSSLSSAQCSSQNAAAASSYSVQQQYYYNASKSSATTSTTSTANSTCSNNSTMSSGNSTTTIGNSAECNRRKKRILHSSLDTASYNEMKKCKANSNRTSASNSPRRPESPLDTLDNPATLSPASTSDDSNTQAKGSGSGSSSCSSVETTVTAGSNTKQQPVASRDEAPVSEFYQSLLESSYTDDGFGQLSEREMIQKALEESALDFVKRCDGSKASHEDKYGTTDEEYDSPSP
ncbi:OTU domain-containing protein 5-A [Anopheles darlingi]|uniref:ubiquitinyl hydrolase 1 n=1 Tax=Anopheles darlingi TaxID=43151 RepID=W5J6X1_ANODA|nr:OTU domain-containing protein 5-A [Anopheles darlingi]